MGGLPAAPALLSLHLYVYMYTFWRPAALKTSGIPLERGPVVDTTNQVRQIANPLVDHLFLQDPASSMALD